MKIFAERLKFEREYNKMTQTEFAEKLGIPRNTYHNYEMVGKNGREPPFELVVKMAKILDVRIDYLFGLED